MILVIDDNAGFARTLCRMLERGGYRVRVASTAELGLSFLLHPEPGDEPLELALIDYRLDVSDLDGVELARRARQGGVTEKFILISGEETRGLPLHDFECKIGKPIMATELIEILNKHTGRANAMPLPQELADAAAAAGVDVPPEVPARSDA